MLNNWTAELRPAYKLTIIKKITKNNRIQARLVAIALSGYIGVVSYKNPIDDWALSDLYASQEVENVNTATLSSHNTDILQLITGKKIDVDKLVVFSIFIDNKVIN